MDFRVGLHHNRMPALMLSQPRGDPQKHARIITRAAAGQAFGFWVSGFRFRFLRLGVHLVQGWRATVERVQRAGGLREDGKVESSEVVVRRSLHPPDRDGDVAVIDKLRCLLVAQSGFRGLGTRVQGSG
jgi:hypothetical protein